MDKALIRKMSLIRKIKDYIEPSYKALYNHCIKLFYYLPIKKDKMVFVQGVGGGYRCNLKYIAEEIHRQQLPYDMVWLVNKMDVEIPSFIRKVKYNRIKVVYELATARVFINNSKSLYPVKKKQGQTFIYIPHGQPGCKCAEADGNLPEIWMKNSQFHSSQTDVFVSMGKYHTQVLKDTFWVPENAEIWETGFPRNDQYYSNSLEFRGERLETIDKINLQKKKLGVPEGVKIALYAPTFRDSGKTDAYDMDLHRVLDALEKKTGDKWMFFITLHPNFAWFEEPPYPFDERIWNMSSYEDIHELMLAVDLAISDYSSAALDFANLRRPVLLYASDIDEYTRMRGLKPMYYQLPFPLARNNDEMEQNILNYDKEERLKQFNEWMKDPYGSVDDGHASERFVERLKSIII